MAKKRTNQTQTQNQQQQAQTIPWMWLAIGGILLIIGGFMAWGMSGSNPPDVETKVNTATELPKTEIEEKTSGPRLAVEQDIIDEGDQKLNDYVETTFTLQNIGDEPLKIMGEPQVELVEGC